MRQGIDTLEIDQMAAPQAQGIETLGSMEDAPMIPNGGIQAAVPEATEMLAAAGREGDIYVVHASEGDTVIPEEVLAGEGGAQIREMLFRQMAQMGVDPQRYVVGNELNSINPETGLPEFFFKKIFKSIKKIFKKVAPIVLPIALSFTGIGAIAAGAIGSGIGTLIQGGSAKDALKAAAFGGITGGIASGISGVLGGATGNVGTDFLAGVKGGLPSGFFGGASTVPFIGPGGGPGESPVSVFGRESTPTLRGSQTGPTAVDNLRTSFTDRLPGLNQEFLGSGVAGPDPGTLIPRQGVSPGVRPTFQPPAGATNVSTQTLIPQPVRPQTPLPRVPNVAAGAIENLTGSPGLGRVFPSWLGGRTDAQLLADQTAKIAKLDELIASRNLTGASAKAFRDAQIKKIVGASNLGQYIGPGLGIGALAYLGGAFEAEQDPFQSQARPIDQRLVRQARLFNDDATPNEIRAPARIPTTFQPIDPGFARFPTNLTRASSTAFGAYGGETQNFPPRIGAISGPGTEKSDDVPAMLSDGEFVMTAQAVRGAGNGSRRQGVKNLYDIMRNFEAVA